MLKYIDLLNEVIEEIPAYTRFLNDSLGKSDKIPEFTQLPLQNKQNYLLTYPMKEMAREKDLNHFHIIGASSGFSKSGAVYWPKRPVDEAGYMQSIEGMFANNYHIKEKRTLILECLAFGMWIGGMQIAAAIRNIALSGKYPLTIATPGLNINTAVNIIKEYKDMFAQILVITNPSNISLFTALFNNENIKLSDGTLSFPVVGEYFTESFREQVSLTYGHSIDSPYVVWTGYGSADTGDLGAETASTIALRKYYHRHPNEAKEMFGTTSVPMILSLSPYVYIEIIDGNIVVTKDQFIPLIRYNTNDNGGLIFKNEIKGKIPSELWESIPEEMIYVFGRANNAVIFYGTNLMINDISEFLLSIPSERNYGGLFTIHEKEEKGISTFEFNIYVTSVDKSDKDWYLTSLISFLCNQSAEFKIKYNDLSGSVDIPLISVNLLDIKDIDTKVKHRFII